MQHIVTLLRIALLMSICGPAQAAFLGYVTLPNGPGTITSDGLGGREIVSMSFGLVVAPDWPLNPVLPRETNCVGCGERIGLGSSDYILFDSENTTGFDSFVALITNDVSDMIFFVADYFGIDQTFQGGLITGGGSGFSEQFLFGRSTDLVGNSIREIRAIPLVNSVVGSVDEGYSFESLVRWEFYGDGASFRDLTRFDPPVSVPEPGAIALFGIGLIGMGLARRRRS